jgi:hypothetical protein
LIEHPGIHETYGRAETEKYFSVEKMVDNLILVYQDILLSRPNTDTGGF